MFKCVINTNIGRREGSIVDAIFLVYVTSNATSNYVFSKPWHMIMETEMDEPIPFNTICKTETFENDTTHPLVNV